MGYKLLWVDMSCSRVTDMILEHMKRYVGWKSSSSTADERDALQHKLKYRVRKIEEREEPLDVPRGNQARMIAGLENNTWKERLLEVQVIWPL